MNDIDQNNISDAVMHGLTLPADKEINASDDLMAKTQSILQKAREAQQKYMDAYEETVSGGGDWRSEEEKPMMIGNIAIPALTPKEAPYKTTYVPIHGHDFKGAVVQRNGKNYEAKREANPLYLSTEERADMIRMARAQLAKKPIQPREEYVEDVFEPVEQEGEEVLSFAGIMMDATRKLTGYEIEGFEKVGTAYKITVRKL